jgi:hypothetical protein
MGLTSILRPDMYGSNSCRKLMWSNIMSVAGGTPTDTVRVCYEPRE